MRKTLTVVVPVYKVEKYINKCLDSLILPEPLMDKIEVLVVNDGTPDNSAVLAREYEKRYPSVYRIIDKENGGHGSAWNLGLKEAKGDYIRFLDSDDWFDKEGLIVLIEKLESTDADIVFSDYYRYYMEDGSSVKYPLYGIESNKVIDADFFDWQRQNMNITNFWYCAYRTRLLQPYCPLFLEGVSYDDSILFVVPLIQAKKVCYLDVPVYYYLLGRPGQSGNSSIMKRHYRARHKTHMQVFDYYLAHKDEVKSDNRKEILSRILNNMLRDDFVDLSYSSFSDKAMMKEWCDRCEKISQSLTIQQDLLDSKGLFKRLPYPVYYWLRKAKKTGWARR